MNDIREGIAARLAGHALFRPLSAARRLQLAGATREVALAAGEPLFHQGDPCERFFLVETGQIKLSRTSRSGHEKIIELFGPGQAFAEAVMFMDIACYPVDATAVTDARLLAVGNAAYREILTADTTACLELLGDLSMHLHDRVAEIERLTLRSARERLADYLLALLPEGATAGTTLRLPVPKQTIAARLSVSPETLSRSFAQLTEAGILSLRGREVTVHAPERLRRDGE